ncbi:hypothetical protein UFOVP132_199 [uncultured Caudovirales phage]|uniref:EF-hand domain-containing protein n=1 Tax=uncultured Caudovirales phage TaxID=2100421 RepID=A0A6J5LB06_9CAUD|nr:hypothetical protein UFOVP132_199 [uncultured Caudovirales phage]
METLIGIAFILAVGFILWKVIVKKETVQEAVNETVADVKSAADVNKDGQINTADLVAAVQEVKAIEAKAEVAVEKVVEEVKAAEVVVEKAVEEVKVVAEKTKAVVKRATTRKKKVKKNG